MDQITPEKCSPPTGAQGALEPNQAVSVLQPQVNQSVLSTTSGKGSPVSLNCAVHIVLLEAGWAGGLPGRHSDLLQHGAPDRPFRAACKAWLKGFGSCSQREGTGPLHPGCQTGPLRTILSNPNGAPAVLSSNDAPGRGWDHICQDSPAAGSSCNRRKTSVPSVRGGSELCQDASSPLVAQKPRRHHRSCPSIDREEGRDNRAAQPPPQGSCAATSDLLRPTGAPIGPGSLLPAGCCGDGPFVGKTSRQRARGAVRPVPQRCGRRAPAGSMEPINKHAARPGQPQPTGPADAWGSGAARNGGRARRGQAGAAREGPFVGDEVEIEGRPLVPRAWRRSASLSPSSFPPSRHSLLRVTVRSKKHLMMHRHARLPRAPFPQLSAPI